MAAPQDRGPQKFSAEIGPDGSSGAPVEAAV